MRVGICVFLTVRIEAVSVGALLLCAVLLLIAGRDEIANMLYRHYERLPDPKWRPRWMPWRFRPTLRQTKVLTWLLVGFAAAFGSYAIIAGFR